MHWVQLYTVRIVACITLAFACSTTYTSAQSGDAPRNILLLMCDHFRYDATGYAGNPYAVTPNLDKLAASGTVFSRTYCQNPLCVPSRTSILTSRCSALTTLRRVRADVLPTYDRAVAGRLRFRSSIDIDRGSAYLESIL